MSIVPLVNILSFLLRESIYCIFTPFLAYIRKVFRGIRPISFVVSFVVFIFRSIRSFFRFLFLLPDYFRQSPAALVVFFCAAAVFFQNVSTLYALENREITGSRFVEIDPLIRAGQQNRNIALLPYVGTDSAPKLGPNGEDNDEIDLHLSQAFSSFAGLSRQTFIASANAAQRDPGEDDDGSELYTVNEGDTLSGIAKKFGITINTILWANNIDNVDAIAPGDQLFILPVAGLKHKVTASDTLDDIAKEYKADKESIIAFNDLPANGEIQKGQELIIPGGEKEIPQTTPLFDERQYVSPSTTNAKYVEKRHSRPNRFPYGYCTWYVAQHKYIPWRGNTGAWLYNAKAMGYSTGSKPRVGSIVVTTEDRRYGHVAIVVAVGNGTITVKEMNYKGFAIESTRTLSSSSRVIKGYIY